MTLAIHPVGLSPVSSYLYFQLLRTAKLPHRSGSAIVIFDWPPCSARARLADCGLKDAAAATECTPLAPTQPEPLAGPAHPEFLADRMVEPLDLEWSRSKVFQPAVVYVKVAPDILIDPGAMFNVLI